MAAAIPRHLLETLVNCPVCCQRYHEPKVLPTCGHTICLNCLEQEWDNAKINDSNKSESNVQHFCPVKNCRKEISPSIINHQDLPINQTIVDLIGSCNFHVEESGPCQICQQSPSFVKCSHCSLFACFECANQHRRETLTTITNHINTLEQEYLSLNDQIDQSRKLFLEQRQQSLENLRTHYKNLLEQIQRSQREQEERFQQQSMIFEEELEIFIDENKQHCEDVQRSIQELRTTITDWSTIEQFKHLQNKLTQLQGDIEHISRTFQQRLPEMKWIDIDYEQTTRHLQLQSIDSTSPLNEYRHINGKLNHSASSTGSTRHPIDDSISSKSLSITNEPIKNSSTRSSHRSMKKHSNHPANHYKSLNILNEYTSLSATQSIDLNTRSTIDEDFKTDHNLPNINNHRVQTGINVNLYGKTVSSSIADLSLVGHHSKPISTARSSSFQSKIDHYHLESYKKISLSQSFDWGILAVTNNDLILLYNKDKTSLIVYDTQGQENERIQWSDGDIKDLCIYRDDTIVIVGEHKQASKPIECKLYVCNLTRKQLERERTVERGLNCQRIASDEESIFYASEKGCNKSKVSVFDQELQLQTTFESGVEVRSLAVDRQCCYVLGKRREREPARYFIEKRHKNGQLIRRIDLYEINVDNMNRLLIDPISHGVIITDGGNKKIWSIGPEGEKKSIQFRPWPWNLAFSVNDIMLILHAGCLTFHAVNPAKQSLSGSRTRTANTITS